MVRCATRRLRSIRSGREGNRGPPVRTVCPSRSLWPAIRVSPTLAITARLARMSSGRPRPWTNGRSAANRWRPRGRYPPRVAAADRPAKPSGPGSGGESHLSMPRSAQRGSGRTQLPSAALLRAPPRMQARFVARLDPGELALVLADVREREQRCAPTRSAPVWRSVPSNPPRRSTPCRAGHRRRRTIVPA